MAHRKKGSKRWYISYNVPGKKAPVNESFATAKEARAREHEIRAIKEISPESLIPAVASGRTFAALAEEYYKETDLSPSTIRNDLSIFRNIILPEIGHIDVAGLTPDNIDALWEKQKKKVNPNGTTPSRRGFQRHWQRISAVIRWATKNRIIKTNPFAGYSFSVTKKDKRTAQAELYPPTPEEVEALVRVSPPHLIRAIKLSAYLGVRVGPSELLKLQWTMFDLDAGWARVRSADKGGDPWRDVPLVPAVIPLLRLWYAEDKLAGICWCVHFRGRPIGTFKTAWARAKLKAGITRKLRPYDFRLYYCTELIEQGVDPKTVAELMGHVDTRMVNEVYQRVRKAAKMKAVEKFRGFRSDLSGKSEYGETNKISIFQKPTHSKVSK